MPHRGHQVLCILSLFAPLYPKYANRSSTDKEIGADLTGFIRLQICSSSPTVFCLKLPSDFSSKIV